MKYEHDYASYKVPAPVIADAQMATEDCAGGLTTTHTLARALMGELDEMQDIARQQKERPGTIDPEAVNGRLEELWAIAQTIESQIKDHIILLYAIIDKHNEEDLAHRKAA